MCGFLFGAVSPNLVALDLGVDSSVEVYASTGRPTLAFSNILTPSSGPSRLHSRSLSLQAPPALSSFSKPLPSQSTRARALTPLLTSRVTMAKPGDAIGSQSFVICLLKSISSLVAAPGLSARSHRADAKLSDAKHAEWEALYLCGPMLTSEWGCSAQFLVQACVHHEHEKMCRGEKK